MLDHDTNFEQAVDGLDRAKRDALMRLAKGSAFVAPVVMAFLMQGLSVQPAAAQPAFSSNKRVSDIRLKRDVTRIGTHPSGCDIYQFRYLWSDEVLVGAIAQDVRDHVPGAVVPGPGPYLAVDYGVLGMQMLPAGAS